MVELKPGEKMSSSLYLGSRFITYDKRPIFLKKGTYEIWFRYYPATLVDDKGICKGIDRTVFKESNKISIIVEELLDVDQNCLKDILSSPLRSLWYDPKGISLFALSTTNKRLKLEAAQSLFNKYKESIFTPYLHYYYCLLLSRTSGTFSDEELNNLQILADNPTFVYSEEAKIIIDSKKNK